MSEQGFYKNTGVEVIFGQHIESPNYKIHIEDKDTYTFPIDGWYYFDTRDEAETFFQFLPAKVTHVRNAQLRQWLIEKNLDEVVEAKLADSSKWPSIKDWKIAKSRYEYEPLVNRNDPLVEALGHDLNMTDAEMDAAFVEISLIP